MNKLKVVLSGLLISSVALVSTNVNAATSTDIINYAKASHELGGKTYTLSSANIAKVERFFETNTITEAQGDTILAKLREAEEVIKSANVANIEDLSAEQKQQVLALLNEAGSVVGVTVSYDKTNKTISVYQNGTQVEDFSVSGKLPFTGTNVAPFVSVLAVIAIAMFALTKKGLKNNA